MKKRALLVINFHARRGKKFGQKAIAILQELGFELLDFSNTLPQELPNLIRQYHQDVDLVIIGSGDGTIRAAIAGLLETQLPLGILPLGTANNLARSLGIPLSIPKACELIAQGKRQNIDLGWLNGHYFINVAGMGLSTQINQQVTAVSKRRWGVLAYAAEALKQLFQTKPFEVEIRTNGQSVQVKTRQITICNGRYYGSGLIIAEDAAIDDQRLDLYSLEVDSAWRMLFLLPALMRGNYTKYSNIRTIETTEIELHTLQPCLLDADGEVIAQTPAYFRVIPQALTVFSG